MTNKKTVVVQNTEIHLLSQNETDYISLTDMTRHFENGGSLIEAWLRNKNTVEFLGIWEQINNPDFNSLEFEGIKAQAGLNRFTLSVKMWVERTNGIGLIAKAGRYGGTFAHRDIAFEFGSWLSPEFKLYLIKEFQRFKTLEAQSNQLEWNVKRLLAKAQYRIHTEAIKNNLIPPTLSKQQIGYVYASEADLLNVALFGMTAKEWNKANPDKKGNIRDDATIEQLTVLAGLESQNALLIELNYSQEARLTTLNDLATRQLKALLDNPAVRKLSE